MKLIYESDFDKAYAELAELDYAEPEVELVEDEEGDYEGRIAEIEAEKERLSAEIRAVNAEDDALEAHRNALYAEYQEKRKLMFTSHDDPKRMAEIDAELREVEAELGKTYKSEIEPRLKRIEELNAELRDLQDAAKERELAKLAERSEAPTDDDWDEFGIEYLPLELDYDNFDLEVKDPDFGKGEIHGYTYILEDVDLDEVKKIASEYLEKPVDEILCSDLFSIDRKDFEWFLEDYFEERAYEKFKADWNDGEIDKDKVVWVDEDDFAWTDVD